MTIVNLPIEALRQRLVQGDTGRDVAYRESIGFVPPCCDWRGAAALDTRLRDMHEQIQRRALVSPLIDAKSAHLILLAMLLAEHGAGAVAQGTAALRAGASWSELRAVVDLAFVLHGLPAANRGEEMLSALADREREDRIAGAVAAYG